MLRQFPAPLVEALRFATGRVVKPGPGPISKTFGPRWVSPITHGSLSATVLRQWLERHSHRCKRNSCRSPILESLLPRCRPSGNSLYVVISVLTAGQQLRLMHGMRLLAEQAKVTYAALESGYSMPSAFTSMFRKALGITPSSYFR